VGLIEWKASVLGEGRQGEGRMGEGDQFKCIEGLGDGGVVVRAARVRHIFGHLRGLFVRIGCFRYLKVSRAGVASSIE
jgi:hypothetical protein